MSKQKQPIYDEGFTLHVILHKELGTFFFFFQKWCGRESKMFALSATRSKVTHIQRKEKFLINTLT